MTLPQHPPEITARFYTVLAAFAAMAALLQVLTIKQASADVAACSAVHDGAWPAGQTQTKRDYSRSDLSCAGFNGVTFLIKTRFDGIQFSNGAMKNSTCVFCTFRGAVMNGANMSGSTFDGANMAGADFSPREHESQADLSAAHLVSVDFSAANLSKANLSKANLSASNLKDARLNDANLKGANLGGALNTESAVFVGATYDEQTEFPKNWTCLQIAERGLRFQPTNKALIDQTCDQLDAAVSEELRKTIARRTAAIQQLRQPGAVASPISKN